MALTSWWPWLNLIIEVEVCRTETENLFGVIFKFQRGVPNFERIPTAGRSSCCLIAVVKDQCTQAETPSAKVQISSLRFHWVINLELFVCSLKIGNFWAKNYQLLVWIAGWVPFHQKHFPLDRNHHLIFWSRTYFRSWVLGIEGQYFLLQPRLWATITCWAYFSSQEGRYQTLTRLCATCYLVWVLRESLGLCGLS